jgi:hypothetical protein
VSKRKHDRASPACRRCNSSQYRRRQHCGRRRRISSSCLASPRFRSTAVRLQLFEQRRVFRSNNRFWLSSSPTFLLKLMPAGAARNGTRGHNGLVGGSSLSKPTTHSFEPRDFLLCAKRPRIGGPLTSASRSPQRLFLPLRGFRRSCLWPQNSGSRRRRWRK